MPVADRGPDLTSVKPGLDFDQRPVALPDQLKGKLDLAVTDVAG